MTAGTPEYLYHYTSSAGLLGILQTRELWATHISYFNDAQEYQSALAIAREILQAEIEAATAAEERRVVDSAVELLLAQRPIGARLFVASLTEHNDQLSQWRGYTSIGDGYVIGFRYDELEIQAQKQGYTLVRCVYERHEHEVLIRPVVNEALSQFREGAFATWPDAEDFAMGRYLVGRMVNIAPIIKATGFQEEAEWRLVSPPLDPWDPRNRYRAGRHSIIPYMNFTLAEPETPWTVDLRVGPGPHPLLAQSAVGNLCLSWGVSTRGIALSSLDYREP